MTGCPSGWVHIKRSDERGKKDEYMYDESGCGPKGVHNFCCPAGTSQPTCGWYTQINGNCDSTCPKDTIEIGSYNKNCKKTGTYQSACCSSNHKSMKLYTKGEWGKYPMCEETSSCPAGDSKKSTLLASANAGSGQAICNAYYKGQILPKDPPNERKFCYDGSNSKERFSDCVWYGGVGTMLPGAPKNWCLSGCPSNRVRIGMGYNKDCANFSYRALCCVPHMVDIVQIENPKLDEYRDSLKEYLKNPRCAVPGSFTKRDSNSLVTREQKYPYDVTGHILLQLLTVTGGGSAMIDLMEEAWNSAMGDKFSYLHFPSLREFAQKLHTWQTRGPIELTQQIMCNLNSWNSRASKGAKKSIICVYDPCEDDECDIDTPERRVRAVSSAEPFDHTHRHRHRHLHRHPAPRGTEETTEKFVVLEKRTRTYTARLQGGSVTLTLPDVGLNEIHYDNELMDLSILPSIKCNRIIKL
jgi:chitinase